MKRGVALLALWSVMSGCGLFKKREDRTADCLDEVANTSGRWVALSRAIETARRQRTPAVEAQRREAEAIHCNYNDQACEQRRNATLAAARAAGEALEHLSGEGARRVALRDNPVDMLLGGRVYEVPEGFNGPELAAAQASLDTMWSSCKLACRDLRCSGR